MLENLLHIFSFYLQIGDIFVLKSNKKGKPLDFSYVSWKQMDSYLIKKTETTFTSEYNNLVQKAVQKAVEKKQLPKGNYEYVKNKGHEVTVKEAESPKKLYQINVGAAVSEQRVFTFDEQTQHVKESIVPNIREVQSYEQLVGDINWLGLMGVYNGKAIEYYRFGDWVISFNLKNFYVGTDFVGIIKRDEETKEKLPDEITSQLKDAKNFDPIYQNMRNRMKGKYSLDVAETWIKGKNQDLTRAKNPTFYESSLSLAVFLAESCRNFRTHAINMMAIDLNQNGRLTSAEFLDNHPMARGGTWPKKEFTGFQGLNEENEKSVRPKELSFVR